MELVLDLDLNRVIIESHSLEVINTLMDPHDTSHRYEHMVRDILHLQRAHESLLFQHTQRASNTLADYLAKTGLALHYGSHLFKSPFGECHAILQRESLSGLHVGLS